MHRVLIKIGSFAIYSWGFMVALGFAVAMWVSSRRAKKRGFKPDIVLDFGVVVILASLIGGRLWYVITHIDEFRGHWLDIINPYHHGVFGIAGMAMVGGVILGIIAAFLFCKVKRINFLTLGDIVAPTFLLGRRCDTRDNNSVFVLQSKENKFSDFRRHCSANIFARDVYRKMGMFS